MKEIPLTQGQIAIIDDKDFERVGKFKWCAGRVRDDYYAIRDIRLKGGKKMRVSMARFILNAPAGLQVDHINHHTLDNQRRNLRLCTASQNHQNQKPSGGTSKYKGVSWHRRYKNWQAQCCQKGRRIYLGSFNDEKEAAMAYDKFASAHLGRFALLNKNIYPQDFAC